MTKIHDLSGFLFRPNSLIATLPISQNGFGFPLITHINMGITIDGLAQDLNHHVSAYQKMARITMSDWTCDKNGCVHLLDGKGLDRDFSHYTRSIPASWIISQKAMATLTPKLSLQMTDQSFIIKGDISISRVILCTDNHHLLGNSDKLNGTTICSLRSKGIQTLADMGSWQKDGSGQLTFITKHIATDATWTSAGICNYYKTSDALSWINIGCLVNSV
jgi:hypothetical protein